MPERFDPRLVHADTDLVSLADRLAGGRPGAVSFCLQGPPGTGKSAFVRHLAERMGIEVVQKRAELGVSRRTAERLRDAVELSFGPLEEVEIDGPWAGYRDTEAADADTTGAIYGQIAGAHDGAGRRARGGRAA